MTSPVPDLHTGWRAYAAVSAGVGVLLGFILAVGAAASSLF